MKFIFPALRGLLTSTLRFRENLKGIFWKLLACFAFAGLNACVRYLSGGAGGIGNPLSASVISLFQNIFGCLIMLPFVLKKGLGTLKTQRPWGHAVRVISAVFGIITLYVAFAKMPMAQVVALQFTGPIFSVIGAKLYLKERIGGLRLLGILFGLGGAFILTRPDKAFMGIPLGQGIETEALTMLLPLISAILFAVSKLGSRELASQGEKPYVLTVYLLLFMVPGSALPAMLDWQTPDLKQIGLLAVLGGFGCLAHYSTAKAYAFGEVTFLMPFGFARLIFTAILGVLLFQEFPKNPNLWSGITLIVLSVVSMTWGEFHLKRQKAKALLLKERFVEV